MRGRTVALVLAVLFGAIAVSEAQLGTGSTLVRAAVTSISGTANELTATQSGSTYTLSLPTALTFTGKTVTGGTFSGPAITLGSSSSTGTSCAVANVNTTAVGNVGAGTDDLMTYSLPANALAVNGAFLEIDAVVTFAANANTKVGNFVFGATSQEILNAAYNSNSGTFRFVVTRTGATAQRIWYTGIVGSSADRAQGTLTAAETLSGAVTVKLTGSSGASATDDIVQVAMTVKVCNQ